MVEFLTNYLIPVLLMTGVGIAILLWVLDKVLPYHETDDSQRSRSWLRFYRSGSCNGGSAAPGRSPALR